MVSLTSWHGMGRRIQGYLTGLRKAFSRWPAKLQSALVLGLALLLLNTFGAAAYLSYRWHEQSLAKLTGDREIISRLELASAQALHGYQMREAFLLTGKASNYMDYRSGLRKLDSSLADLKPQVIGSGDLAISIDHLSSLVTEQVLNFKNLIKVKNPEDSGTVILGMKFLKVSSDQKNSQARGKVAKVRIRIEENFMRINDLFHRAINSQQKLLQQLDMQAKIAYWCFLVALVLGNLLAFGVIGWVVYLRGNQSELGAVSSLALKQARSMLGLLNVTTDAIYGINLQGECIFISRSCLQLLGYAEASQLMGKNMNTLVFPGSGANRHECPLVVAMQAGKNFHFAESIARRADGIELPVEGWSNLVYEENEIVGAAVKLVDITLSKAKSVAETGEHEALELQVRILNQHSKEMELFGQLTEMLQSCTGIPELCKIVSIFSKDFFPQISGAFYIMEPDSQSLAIQIAWGNPLPPGQAPFNAEDCWSIRRGKPYYHESSRNEICCTHVALPPPAFTFCLPLVGQGKTLGMLHLWAGAAGLRMDESTQLVAIALSYQVAMGFSNLKFKESLRDEAIRDSVTGLFNRRFMKESLDHEIQRAQRTGKSVGVIAFDLDHFKMVNDTLGHSAGDSLLQGIANLAKSTLRAEDISCRQGGDEFLLILPDISERDTLALAEELRQKAGQFTLDQFPGLNGKITLSAGVAMYPQDASTSESLQKAADKALYHVKSLGRNQVFAASGLVSLA